MSAIALLFWEKIPFIALAIIAGYIIIQFLIYWKP